MLLYSLASSLWLLLLFLSSVVLMVDNVVLGCVVLLCLVSAAVVAWFLAQEDGLAVANILYGRVNPSGKTPVTWGKAPREAAYTRQTQWPGGREDTGRPGGPGFDPEDHVFDQRVARYIEGLEMGYRWFEAHTI